MIFLSFLADIPDFEYLVVASAVIRARQHADGAKRGLKIRLMAASAEA